MKKLAVAVAAFAALILSSCGSNPAKQAAKEVVLSTPLDSMEIKYAPKLGFGDVAPVFSAPDTTGKEVSLADFAGKYVVLDFWATWCPDCIDELPTLKNLYNTYKDQKINGLPVEFISISFDDNESAWKKFIVRENMQWHQISNLIKWKQNPISEMYQIGWIPTFYVVGPDGKLIGSAIKAFRIGDFLESQK